MDLNVNIKDNYLIARPSGKIDATNSEDFTASLLELLNKSKQIILDFEKIDYISSAGLRSILIAAKQAKGSGSKFLLCSLQKHIYDIFKMTGFTNMFNILPTLQDAESLLQ